MWDAIATWTLGLLGIGASANWWARASTRQVAALKAQAELLQLLPDGDGKTRWVRYLDRRSVDLVLRLERAETHWARRMRPRAEATWFTGAVVTLLGAITATAAQAETILERSGAWLAIAGIAGMGVGILLWVVAGVGLLHVKWQQFQRRNSVNAAPNAAP